MDFHKVDFVHKCIPPILGIATAWEKYQEDLAAWEADPENNAEPEEVKPIIFHLKCVPLEESGEDIFRETKARAEHAPQEAQRIIDEITRERVNSKVVKIENLNLDGEECTDFDTLYKQGPPELASWVAKAVYSSYVLAKAEIKN